MRPFRRIPIAAVAVLAAAPLTAQQPAGAEAGALTIPFERVTLDNGLNVILSPDHTTPQVVVDVWYHVGSKNEEPGRTGFAHMFEHVMFTGSAHVPYGLHDRLTEGVGGYNNGSTNNDRTNYFESVPSNYLESALWLESDRMGFLLDKLDEAKFTAQRDIVQNERRQGVDNQPYGRASEILTAAAYPPSNPYSWSVIGYMTDLQAATVDDVKKFFRLYYAPSNATIAIVGDFDPAQAKAWVQRYFRDLPAGAAITRPTVTRPVLEAEKSLVYEDRVQVPRLYIRWPTVGVDNAQSRALEYLGEILTGSRTARLTKALVYDLQSAASVMAYNGARENAGDFNIIITPRPGHTLSELKAATDSVLAGILADGPTEEEMARTAAGLQYQFVSSLQSNLGKAEMLNTGLVFHGDPAFYRAEFEAMKAVTAAQVRAAAREYLTPGRVVLSVVPLGETQLAADADQSIPVTVAEDGGHYIMEPR